MFTSCKSTTASLQRATATSIGNTLSSEVTVSNVKRSASNVSWDAKKDGECYECESDDMVRRTNCKKVKCKN
jgi:hypothetical protein